MRSTVEAAGGTLTASQPCPLRLASLATSPRAGRNRSSGAAQRATTLR